MEKPKPDGGAPTKSRLRPGAVPVGLFVVGLLAVGLIAWLALGDDDSTSGSTGAEIVTVDALRDAAVAQGTPVYWAGTQGGAELELSQPDENRTYVRYLTGGAEAGDPRPDFLTVGTYALVNPVAALRRQGKQPGGVLGKAPGGATVYFDRNRPSSVYLAYPGVDVQVEVYDPNFKQALQLVNSGQIVRAG